MKEVIKKYYYRSLQELRKPKILILIAAVSVVVLIVSGVVYHLVLPGEDVLLTISSGALGDEIAGMLKERKLIFNEDIFLTLSYFTGSTKKLQSGTYRFSRRMTLLKILYMLRYGKTHMVRVTIPEGYTALQIAGLIESKNLGSSKKFMEIVKEKNLEGYLFPETYFFSPGITEREMITCMKKEFYRRCLAELDVPAERMGMSRHEIVTLGSIIEKEAKTDRERRIISAVFHNRLKKRWMLESCATVRYALGKYNKKLRYHDLKVNSKYNTYRNWGLPPGPICSPGLKSIRAALSPAPGEKDTMFFFFKEEGTHQFSKYYRQHIEGLKKKKLTQK
jgi:UPF0755 protein